MSLWWEGDTGARLGDVFIPDNLRCDPVQFCESFLCDRIVCLSHEKRAVPPHDGCLICTVKGMTWCMCRHHNRDPRCTECTDAVHLEHLIAEIEARRRLIHAEELRLLRDGTRQLEEL